MGRNLRSEKNLISSESGMTLLEVMIVSGLLMVVAMGMASLMTNLGKQQKKVERDGDIVQLQNNVRTTSGNPQSLSTSLNVVD